MKSQSNTQAVDLYLIPLLGFNTGASSTSSTSLARRPIKFASPLLRMKFSTNALSFATVVVPRFRDRMLRSAIDRSSVVDSKASASAVRSVRESDGWVTCQAGVASRMSREGWICAYIRVSRLYPSHSVVVV